MSLLAMPIVVANLGGEMLYILQQRLLAQAIPNDKSVKVMNDVVAAMFEPSFVESIFRPGETYTLRSTRNFFDRVAHSSIMRLSESSMDKLFDLMMMGFKYQIMCCVEDTQILEVTLTHLTEIRGSVGAVAHRFIENVETLMKSTYGSLSMGQWHGLRQTLFAFVQSKRVKVSLFLQEKIQDPLGHVVLPPGGNEVEGRPVGTVITYAKDGGILNEEKLALQCLHSLRDRFYQHPLRLGGNLYDKSRPRPGPSIQSAPLVGSCQEASMGAPGGENGATRSGGQGDAENGEASKTRGLACGDGKHEFNLLFDLIAPGTRGTGEDNFKLNPLPLEVASEGPVGKGRAERLSSIPTMSSRRNVEYVEKLGADIGCDIKTSTSKDEQMGVMGGGDLLDLMDSMGA